jgi:Ca2+-binding RTX toxin-like protein
MRARRRAAARRKAIRSLLIVPLVVLALSTAVVFSAANVVADSKAAYRTSTVTANQLKPQECNGIDLSNVVVSFAGTVNGTGGNDLILGSGGGQRLNGLGGDDCIIGGGGGDRFDGGPQNDVCIGGPGNDKRFTNCETTYQ